MEQSNYRRRTYTPEEDAIIINCVAKKYKRENCNSTLRATVTDALGRTVSLFGTHAFEWSIVIASDNSITMQTFKKGDIARKEFNKYKRKR